MYLRELVKTNCVMVNGEYTNVGVKLRANDFVELTVDMSRGTSMQPEDVSLDIVYEDAAIIVVNKPAGMLVHPTHREKRGTLLNALAFHFNAECVMRSAEQKQHIRPGLVHRLDKETSGLIVIAKSVEMHRRLAREFMKKRVEKRYIALVEGKFPDDTGVIEAPIGRYAEKKIWDVKHDGKASITRFRVVGRLEDTTLLELEPVTGRTNQLRIHCASVGHPIIGDTARDGREFDRMCLHAAKLAFRHPVTKERMEFVTDIPSEFISS